MVLGRLVMELLLMSSTLSLTQKPNRSSRMLMLLFWMCSSVKCLSSPMCGTAHMSGVATSCESVIELGVCWIRIG
jgi:hypothetical protein